MEFVYILLSFIFTISLLFLFYLDSKKIINFTSKFGFFIAYLYNFVLIAAYFLWCLKQDGDLDNSLLAQIFAKKTEIALIILIVLCNFFTKLFFKTFDVEKNFKVSNSEHSSIMNGMFTTFGIIGAVCKNFNLVFTIVLFFLGNSIGFYIRKPKKPDQTPDDNTPKRKKQKFYIFTVIITCFLVVISNVRSETIQKYENYILFVPIILLIITMIITIVICIKYPERVKEEFKNLFINFKKFLAKRIKEEKQKIKLKLYK